MILIRSFDEKIGMKSKKLSKKLKQLKSSIGGSVVELSPAPSIDPGMISGAAKQNNIPRKTQFKFSQLFTAPLSKMKKTTQIFSWTRNLTKNETKVLWFWFEALIKKN